MGRRPCREHRGSLREQEPENPMDALGRRAVGIALATQAAAIGTTFGSFSLFVRPLEQAFEAARWQVSLGPTLLVVALAIGGMTLGPLLDRGALRPVILGAALVHAVALALASQASSLVALGLVCFGLGFAIPPLGPLGGATLIGRSVPSGDRGRALGMINLGAPLGGFAFASLAGLALDAWGWRQTLLLYAGISAAINVPAAWLVPTRFPEGLSGADGEAGTGWSMAQLLRSPAFVLLGLVFAISMGVGAGWTSQLAPYLEELGFSLRETALVVATGAGVAGVGTLGLGALADRISSARLLGVALATGALCWLAYALSPSKPIAFVTVLAFGIISGGVMPVYTHLVAERFGAASLGRALALTNLFMLPMSAAGGPLTAAVHDTTGSYRPALLAFILAYGLAIASLAASGRRLAPDGTAR